MTSRILRACLLLACLSIIGACNLSTSSNPPDTLTFTLPDSLKASAGKYDEVRLDLYTVSGGETLFLKTLFSGPYNEPGQLEKLPLPPGLQGDFLIHVIASKDGQRRLHLGVPFAHGRTTGQTMVYPVDPVTPPPANRAPVFTAGIHDRTMKEGDTATLTIKAKDEDGDAFTLRLVNLDSLRGLFPARPDAISIASAADSLAVKFDPGAAPANYRFRFEAKDSAGASSVQVVVVSVGRVNRPPRLTFASSGGSASFRVLEGQTLTLRVEASDPDSGQAVRLLSLMQPPWPRCGDGAYDTTTGVLTFRPGFTCVAEGESDLPNLVFRAMDNGEPPETGELSGSLTVVDVNTAPKWGPKPDTLRIKEGRSLTLPLAGHYLGDAEGDSVSFSASCGSVLPSPLQWIFTAGFRDAGRKTCTLTATDSHHPSASSQLAIDLSIEDSARALEVDILEPKRGAIFRDSLIPVSWQVENRPQSLETTETLKTEGPNLIRRSFRDSLGNEGVDTLTVFLDTKPPAKPKVRTLGWTNQGKPRWTWQGGGGGNGQFRVRLDTLDFRTGGESVQDTAFAPSSSLKEGRHVLYVQERDAAGNWSPTDSGTVQVDLTAPVVTFAAPADGHVTNLGAVQVRWSVDGEEQAAFSHTLIEGGNAIARTVKDSAGNEGRGGITVTRRSQVVFVNAAAAAGGDGNSWATAARTLQAGLARAQNGWEIWVARGTYLPSTDATKVDTSFVMKTGISLLGGFVGSETLQSHRDWKSNSTIIRGEAIVAGQTDARTMPLVIGSEQGRLDGFVLENGRSYQGSAVYVVANSMNVSNCVFRNHSGYAENGGGVISAFGSDFTLMNSEFTKNSNTGEAGVLYIAGQNALVSNTQFIENRTGRAGGAIYVDRDASAILSHSIFQGNVSTSGAGGAICHRGSVEIRNSVFLENSAGYQGGAISAHLGYLTLSNCVFAGNVTDGNGGALHNYFAKLTGTNLTFYGNSSKGQGGAVYYEGFSSTNSDIRFQNTIFWANHAVGPGPQIAISPTLPDNALFVLQYSILEGGTAAVPKPDAPNVSFGPGLSTAQPQFRNPNTLPGIDGKWMTPDDGLSPNGGPAINAGILSGSPNVDITGASRPKGGFIDLGAYEP